MFLQNRNVFYLIISVCEDGRKNLSKRWIQRWQFSSIYNRPLERIQKVRNLINIKFATFIPVMLRRFYKKPRPMTVVRRPTDMVAIGNFTCNVADFFMRKLHVLADLLCSLLFSTTGTSSYIFKIE
jgi:hypothetical protein